MDSREVMPLVAMKCAQFFSKRGMSNLSSKEGTRHRLSIPRIEEGGREPGGFP